MDEREFKLTKNDYLRNKAANIELIKNNLIQIEMAKKVIQYFDEEISKFQEEIDEVKDNTPIGVY